MFRVDPHGPTYTPPFFQGFDIDKSLSTKYFLCVLSSILSEDNLSQSSFEGIASTFHHAFQRQDHFRVGSALVSLVSKISHAHPGWAVESP